jgi:hypothetical protein
VHDLPSALTAASACFTAHSDMGSLAAAYEADATAILLLLLQSDQQRGCQPRLQSPIRCYFCQCSSHVQCTASEAVLFSRRMSSWLQRTDGVTHLHSFCLRGIMLYVFAPLWTHISAQRALGLRPATNTLAELLPRLEGCRAGWQVSCSNTCARWTTGIPQGLQLSFPIRITFTGENHIMRRVVVLAGMISACTISQTMRSDQQARVVQVSKLCRVYIEPGSVAHCRPDYQTRLVLSAALPPATMAEPAATCSTCPGPLAAEMLVLPQELMELVV